MIVFLLLIFIFPFAFSACYTEHSAEIIEMIPPQTGTWGDQGDGTFVNPVLNSNYPDCDVEKDGDTWYMISSKGKYMKGMTVIKSKDLVNWEEVGGIVDEITWNSETGVWAGDLVKRGNIWYCYFIDFSKGLFVCTAENIEGVWSKPELLLEKKGMTDPAVFWDEEMHQAYMACNYEIEKEGKKRIHHLRLFKLSWDGMHLEDDGTEFYSHTGAEAAKIYKINGQYYIFLSEWTLKPNGYRDDRRQIVLRSQNIFGPYEKKILLERDERTFRSCCQGSLVEAPDSSWWYFHQMVQCKDSYEGRPQFLIPVTWVDGWPLLGKDIDGNGIGNTVWRCCKPVQGHPIRMISTDDDFNSQKLSGHWLWDGNPDRLKWSLADHEGYLRLYASNPVSGSDAYKSLPNKLLQRKMGRGIDTVTVRMDMRGMIDRQKAGLLHIGHNYMAVGVLCHNREKFVYSETNRENGMIRIPDGNYIYLRTCFVERTGHCEYSFDGKSYKRIGDDFTLQTKGFDGIFIGLFSMNQNGSGYVDFDWFKYDYDGPKSQKLMVS